MRRTAHTGRSNCPHLQGPRVRQITHQRHTYMKLVCAVILVVQILLPGAPASGAALPASSGCARESFHLGGLPGQLGEQLR